MKKSNLLLSLLMAVTFLAFTTACEDDAVVIPPSGGGDILVGDGFYITQTDVDPLSTSQLVIEQVEDGLDNLDRVDFYANYVYLTAGNYNIVNVESKAITETYGGSLTTETQEDPDQCETFDYSLVASTLDGAAFAVAADGLYKVTYDVQSNEITLIPITTVGLIGDGTTVGWAGSSNLVMTGGLTGEVGAWTLSDVTLRSGSLKMRFNCTWAVDRPDYSFFTNFGGNSDAPMTGNFANLGVGNATGGSIPINGVDGTYPNEGVFTVNVAWTVADGFSLELLRTGDAVVITFDPADYAWGIIGDATQGTVDTDGWNADKKLTHTEDGTTHIWRGVFPLEAGSTQFKFRTDDTWGTKITPGSQGVVMGTITDNTEAGSISEDIPASGDGAWLVDANPGFYYFEIKTADFGETWDMVIDEAVWGAVGAATPGGWDLSTDLVYADDLSSASASVDFIDGEWKFRHNNNWDFPLGGSLDALEFNAANFVHSGGAATKTVTIMTVDGGEIWTATVN